MWLTKYYFDIRSSTLKICSKYEDFAVKVEVIINKRPNIDNSELFSLIKVFNVIISLSLLNEYLHQQYYLSINLQKHIRDAYERRIFDTNSCLNHNLKLSEQLIERNNLLLD